MKPYFKVISALRQPFVNDPDSTPIQGEGVYKPDYCSLSLLAGEKTLTIICDRKIGGLWNCLRYDPCSGTSSDCIQEMRTLIHDIGKDSLLFPVSDILFPISDNCFILNIADNINRGDCREDSFYYQNYIEERIDVFYPIIKHFANKYSNSRAVGLMCYYGAGTGLGLSFLSCLLKADGFKCFSEILQLLCPDVDKDSKPLPVYSQGDLEVFDCSSLMSGSSTISEIYKEGKNSIYSALRNRLIERMANADKYGLRQEQANVQEEGSRTYHNTPRPFFTPNSLSSLKPDEVFVFGSNLRGRHLGGAARLAHNRFGAIMGQGVGMQGHSYAIPTMQGGLETIQPYVDQFIKFAKEHIEYFFYVTRVGCGKAGFKDSEIAPLFSEALGVENICLPESFVKVIVDAPKDDLVPKELTTMMHGQIRTLMDLLKELNKQEPIKDSEDAYRRLAEVVEKNVRYGDEFAFLAMRTIWSIMCRHEDEGEVVNIEQLEKEMFSFHDENVFQGDFRTKVLYDYSASKIIKYIKFLNEFRRYKSYENVLKDLCSIDVSPCSKNDPHYYFSFYEELFSLIMRILKTEWENVSRDGVLDNNLLDDVMFGRYDRMLKKNGLRETIRLAYKNIGCHPDLKCPWMSGKEGMIYGPNYKYEGSRIEKGCSDFRRWPWTNTSFEMRFAESVLERDPNYETIRDGRGELLFIPRTDYSLPVYSSRRGKLHFDNDKDRIVFIRNAGHRSC